MVLYLTLFLLLFVNQKLIQALLEFVKFSFFPFHLMIVLAGPACNDVLKFLHLAGGNKTSLYCLNCRDKKKRKKTCQCIHSTLFKVVIPKKVPLLFHFSGSFANSSLSAAAVVLSQGVLCFLFWTLQAAPMITENTDMDI